MKRASTGYDDVCFSNPAVDWPYTRPPLGRSLSLGQLPSKTTLYQSSGKRKMISENHHEFDDQQPPSKKRKKGAAAGADGKKKQVKVGARRTS